MLSSICVLLLLILGVLLLGYSFFLEWYYPDEDDDPDSPNTFVRGRKRIDIDTTPEFFSIEKRRVQRQIEQQDDSLCTGLRLHQEDDEQPNLRSNDE